MADDVPCTTSRPSLNGIRYCFLKIRKLVPEYLVILRDHPSRWFGSQEQSRESRSTSVKSANFIEVVIENESASGRVPYDKASKDGWLSTLGTDNTQSRTIE
jgi:hypothetical protein